MPSSRYSIALVASLIVLGAGHSARAWNATGHEVSACIAWQDLTPETKAAVSRLLTTHPDFADALTKGTSPTTPPEDRDRNAFLLASTWPDLVRTPGTKSYRYNHPSWHYVDFPFALGDVKPPEIPDLIWEPGKDPANAVQAYAKNMADLMDDKALPADRAMALCWIEHLVGDVHQPLHATSMFSDRFPKGDQGGNLVMVKANQSVTNLHSLWDGMLGSYEAIDAIEHIATRTTTAHPRKEFAEQLKVPGFESWARASFEQAKTVVYLHGSLALLTRDEQNKDKSRPVPEVPENYMTRGKAAADTAIALAGYRMANVLNKLFGHPLPPTTTSTPPG